MLHRNEQIEFPVPYTLYTRITMSSVIHMTFKGFFGNPAQGNAKIKQFNSLDAFIALLQTHLLKQAYCT